MTPKQIKQRREAGKSRAKAFTREYQQTARAKVKHESNVANGRKGGIAYVKKYGVHELIERARKYRLQNPSNLERIVENILVGLEYLGYERESYVLENTTADFAFWDQKKIIYADGDAWHTDTPIHPSLAKCFNRHTRDIETNAILKSHGWKVLRLTENEIISGSARQKIAEFMGE